MRKTCASETAALRAGIAPRKSAPIEKRGWQNQPKKEWTLERGTPPRPRGDGHSTACSRVDGVGKGALKRCGQAHADDLCERTGGVGAGHRPWQTRPPVNGLAIDLYGTATFFLAGTPL
eukprot:SM000119S25645  [mRNA]  locus=s119:187016:188878:- [translate_table: standard]